MHHSHCAHHRRFANLYKEAPLFNYGISSVQVCAHARERGNGTCDSRVALRSGHPTAHRTGHQKLLPRWQKTMRITGLRATGGSCARP
ncbi:hypothetical protein KP509_21G064300 [Ceratopteris richardii]|uniref:Uncharacterized protein n=1 Tax=Ceratopteris richardii TaxID=49495 RepID=A0A8T2SB51_CERRI|nr:hypothetical protein KP509_21G064300 [Ceratopteris richardii]